MVEKWRQIREKELAAKQQELQNSHDDSDEQQRMQ
jgi:hypothetical protein